MQHYQRSKARLKRIELLLQFLSLSTKILRHKFSIFIKLIDVCFTSKKYNEINHWKKLFHKMIYFNETKLRYLQKWRDYEFNIN